MHNKRSNKPQMFLKNDRKKKPGAEIKGHESLRSGSEEEEAEEDETES